MKFKVKSNIKSEMKIQYKISALEHGSMVLIDLEIIEYNYKLAIVNKCLQQIPTLNSANKQLRIMNKYLTFSTPSKGISNRVVV